LQAGNVTFVYHPNRAEEAEAVVPILYTFCLHHLGPRATSWFQPGAEAINFGYKWDSEQETVVCAADQQCNQLLDFGSEMLEDVQVPEPTQFELTDEDGKPFSLHFLIDLETDPQRQIGGSTVGSFGISPHKEDLSVGPMDVDINPATTSSKNTTKTHDPETAPILAKPPELTKTSEAMTVTETLSSFTSSTNSFLSSTTPEHLKSKIEQLLHDGDAQMLDIIQSIQSSALLTDQSVASIVSPAAQSKVDPTEAGGHVE
jgi:hypothetical protein